MIVTIGPDAGWRSGNPDSVVVMAARWWSAARARARAPPPHHLARRPPPYLFERLDHRGLGLLAPAFDGLYACFARRLGRDLRVGGDPPWTKDERRLHELVWTSPLSVAALPRSDPMDCVLAAAVRTLHALISRGEAWTGRLDLPPEGDAPR